MIKDDIIVLSDTDTNTDCQIDASCLPKSAIPSKDTDYVGGYSIYQIKRARSCLIEELYDNQSSKLLHIKIKEKCGIITDDVIDFQLNRKQFKEKSESENTDNNNSQSDNDIKIIPSTIITSNRKDNSPIHEVYDLSHGCDSTSHCLKHIKYASDSSTNDMEVFLCDFCLTLSSTKDLALEHLITAKHFSSSSYFCELIAKNVDGKLIFEKPKINSLKERSIIQSKESKSNVNIFCPSCMFSFGTFVAECSLHSKLVHESNFKYAVAFTEKLIPIEIKRSHLCPTCSAHFRKLSCLMNHIEETKHFPYVDQNQLCVYECPFDTCLFTTIDYSIFKIHLMEHQNYTTNNRDDVSYKINVKLMSKPSLYFHAADFNDSSEKSLVNELKTIESLTEIIKGHKNQHDLIKMLRARKLTVNTELKKIGQLPLNTK